MIAQIDAVLEEVEKLKRASSYSDMSDSSDDEVRAVRTRAAAAIERLAPAQSPYVRDARAAEGFDGYVAKILAGILRALRADFEAGYMTSVEELVHADLFADFLEMADELLVKSYKDAAAVITGSVLEEHLRKLAAKHGVTVESPEGKPRKADTLNADLVKAHAYNKLEQKSVTAWLDLRNKAAHGHYDEYDKGQVEGLVRDVRAFMVRHPA